MGIEDEKTRPARKAVKRKSAADVTDVATRQVKPVKRRSDPFSGFSAVTRVAVLPRGELVNQAGERDNGWVLRDMLDKVDPAWFVLRDEPLLATFSRLLVEQAYDFDVMCGGACVAALKLERVISRFDGRAYLFGLGGRRLARFEISGVRGVDCTDEKGRPLVRLAEVHPTRTNVVAGRRSLATLERVEKPGLLLSSYELDLCFEAVATPFERLCASAAIVAGEAWFLASKHVQRDPDYADGGFSDRRGRRPRSLFELL